MQGLKVFFVLLVLVATGATSMSIITTADGTAAQNAGSGEPSRQEEMSVAQEEEGPRLSGEDKHTTARRCDVCRTWMIELHRLLEQFYCHGLNSAGDIVLPPKGFDRATTEAHLLREQTPAEVLIKRVFAFRPLVFVYQSFWRIWDTIKYVVHERLFSLYRLQEGYDEAIGGSHWVETKMLAADTGIEFLLSRVNSSLESIMLQQMSAITELSDTNNDNQHQNFTLLNFARRAAERVQSKYSWDESYDVLVPRPPLPYFDTGAISDAKAKIRRQARASSTAAIRRVFLKAGLRNMLTPTQQKEPVDAADQRQDDEKKDSSGSRYTQAAVLKLEAILALTYDVLYERRTNPFVPLVTFSSVPHGFREREQSPTRKGTVSSSKETVSSEQATGSIGTPPVNGQLGSLGMSFAHVAKQLLDTSVEQCTLEWVPSLSFLIRELCNEPRTVGDGGSSAAGGIGGEDPRTVRALDLLMPADVSFRMCPAEKPPEAGTATDRILPAWIIRFEALFHYRVLTTLL